MKYSMFFTENGSPKSGLSPTFSSIKDITGTNISQPTISDIGYGFYIFEIDVPYEQQYFALIDGGASLSPNERYKYSVLSWNDFYNKREIFANPSYNEDNDAMTFVVWVHKDGLLEDAITNVKVEIFDSSNQERFEETTTSSTNGIAVLIKNNPSLTNNRQYYIKTTVTMNDNSVISSVTPFMMLE